MTHQEKAKELVEKFYDVQIKILAMNDIPGLNKVEWRIAKQSAIICVEEIINEPGYSDSGSTFYQQVKQEIENL